MKLHRIRVENLNSLYGEQEVDLEGALGDAPLFLIMGPTGSGKSTLMDAVSLALFGQTPRLVKSRTTGDVDDDDSRNVMSRGASSCLAEVTFSVTRSGARERYRARWSVQRARNKPDGRFQSPQRSLEVYRPLQDDWITLVSDHRVKFFQPRFDEILQGMTVADFKRSILLAQGEFAAFLRASDDERAAILERLTDTSLYKELGKRASTLRREAESRLRDCDVKLAELDVLPLAQEDALRAQLEELDQTLRETELRAEALQAGAAHRAHEASLLKALTEARAQLTSLRAERAEHDADLQRLAAVEAQQDTLEAIRQRDAATERAQELRARQTELATTLEGQQKAAAMATERQAQAVKALADARKKNEEHRTAIELARARRDDLKRAKDALDSAREARQRRAGTRQGHAEGLERSSSALQASRDQLQKTREAEEATRADTILESRQPGLIEQWQRVDQAAQAVQRRQEIIEETRTAIREERQNRAVLEHRVTSMAAALQPLVEAAAQAATELAELLLGSASPEARRAVLDQRVEHLTERLAALGAAETALGELEEARSHSTSSRSELQQAGAERASLIEEIARLTATVEEARAALADPTQQLEELQWALSLSDARARLEPGRPCSLCGAEHHPLVSDTTHQELDERLRARAESVRGKLEGLRAALDVEEKLQATAQQALVAAESRIAQLQHVANAAERRRAQRQTAWETLAHSALLTVDSPDIDAARADVSSGLERARAMRHALSEAIETARSAEQQRDAARAPHEAATRELERALGSLEAKREQLKQLEQAALTERQQHDEHAETLLAQLTVLSVPATLDDLAAAMQQLNERVDGRRIIVANHADATRDHAENEREEARSRTQHAESKRLEEEAITAEATARESHDALARTVAGLLADPEAEEARLDAEQQILEDAIEEASTALSEHREAQVETLAERAAVGARLEQSLEESQRAATRVVTCLAGREEQAVLALVLPDEAIALLRALRDRLTRSLAAAETTIQTRSRDLEAHRTKTDPTPADAGEEPELALRSARESIEELLRSQGELRQRLERQRRARRGKDDLLRERARTLQVFEVWKRMHRLIGERDGDRFKIFAQVLNLGDLLERANKRLETLAPRYRLVPARDRDGEPRLAFAVLDKWQARQIRPLNTLSGGESFLVSLALALALADFRSVQLPIETLLLDEGFGTLDDETLSVALAALEQLQSHGTHVGLISHLAGLKDRVQARVIVSPLGNGRSAVHCERD